MAERGPLRGTSSRTWREELLDAQRGIEQAYEHRARVFTAANHAGISMRRIGETVGISAASVHRVIGNNTDKGGASLDSPAVIGGDRD